MLTDVHSGMRAAQQGGALHIIWPSPMRCAAYVARTLAAVLLNSLHQGTCQFIDKRTFVGVYCPKFVVREWSFVGCSLWTNEL